MKKFCVLIILSFFASKCLACLCFFSANKKSVKERIKEADVILYVTAMRDSLSEDFQPRGSSFHVTKTIFKVLKVWKGDPTATIRFNAKRYPCQDAHYRIGERYIVFGYINKKTGELETNNCNSLSEETVPRPEDKEKMASNNVDVERYRKAILQEKQEFEFVTRLISKKTKR